MTTTEVRSAIDAIRKRSRQAKHDYEKVMLLIKHDLKEVQMECPHEWQTRSIMGRDTVTECIHCDLER